LPERVESCFGGGGAHAPGHRECSNDPGRHPIPDRDPRTLRIAHLPRVSDGKAAFAFDFVEEPEDGDEVGEVEQTRYFVAPEVAAPLADAILDTEPTTEGAQLTLKRQE
jgi:hypothetical protein